MKKRKEALLSALGMARRAGTLQIGQDIVKSNLARGESLLVCFAGEGESSFYRSLRNGRFAEKITIIMMPEVSGDELSAAVGAGNVKVVALPLRSGFARSISQLLAEGGNSNE
jgi:ribosomal protein L7Ae-like RNA K-turn-binding protein